MGILRLLLHFWVSYSPTYKDLVYYVICEFTNRNIMHGIENFLINFSYFFCTSMGDLPYQASLFE